MAILRLEALPFPSKACMQAGAMFGCFLNEDRTADAGGGAKIHGQRQSGGWRRRGTEKNLFFLLFLFDFFRFYEFLNFFRIYFYNF